MDDISDQPRPAQQPPEEDHTPDTAGMSAMPETAATQPVETDPQAASAPLPEPVPPLPPRSAQSASNSSSTGRAVGLAVVVALVFGALAGGAAGLAGSWYATHVNDGDSAQSTSIQVIPAETDEPIVAAVAASLPGVVNIDISGVPVTDATGTLPEGHPGVPVSGNGSGVTWRTTEDGGTLIITNAHVVDEAETIVVTGTDREPRTATLVGTDAETDIAVIEIPAELPIEEVGDSDDLSVGQMVVAIGSPYGLSQSVSSGVISAIGRSLPNSVGDQSGVYPLVDVIQTDAAINPGNSGGALVNRYGQLIGINTAIYSESGSSDGIGFAVPINTAVRIAEDLVEYGSAQHPFLGILGRDVDSILAEDENLSVTEGAFIVDVTEGTKAEEADLRAGDVIVLLDDDEIRSMDDLILEVRRRAIGDTVIVTLYRDGERMEVEMEVGIKPSNLDLSVDESPTESPEDTMPPE